MKTVEQNKSGPLWTEE